MKKFISILILFLTFSATQAIAGSPKDKAQRKQWFENMTQAKIDFLAKNINLSQEQKEKFEKTYRAMSAETSRLSHDTRAMERQVAKKASATDLEYEKAAEAIAEYKAKEGAIELQYFKQLKTFLTKKQLFQLKIAENKWMDALMRHRGGRK